MEIPSRSKACSLAMKSREGIASFPFGHQTHQPPRREREYVMYPASLLGSEAEGRRHYFEPPFWQADSPAGRGGEPGGRSRRPSAKMAWH